MDFWLRGTYAISASTYSQVHCRHSKNSKTLSNVNAKKNEIKKRKDKDQEGKESKVKKEKKKSEKELYIYDVEVGTNREKEKIEEEEEEDEDAPLINENENNLENLTDDECEGNLLYTHRLQQIKYWSGNKDENDVLPEEDLSARTQVPSIRATDR